MELPRPGTAYTTWVMRKLAVAVPSVALGGGGSHVQE